MQSNIKTELAVDIFIILAAIVGSWLALAALLAAVLWGGR